MEEKKPVFNRPDRPIEKADMFEVLQDKIYRHSTKLQTCFRRLMSDKPTQKWVAKKEDLKEAIIKDFNLFDKESGRGASEEIKQYQKIQKRKLDQFLDSADVNGNGYIAYKDFIKAFNNLEDNYIDYLMPSKERANGFASKMNVNVERWFIEQNLRKCFKKQKAIPPYGYFTETALYRALDDDKLQNRYKKLRNHFHNFDIMNKNEEIPIHSFKKGNNI